MNDCRYCKKFRIDEARRRTLPPVWGDAVIFQIQCKFCHRDLVANFKEDKIYRLEASNVNTPTFDPKQSLATVTAAEKNNTYQTKYN